MAALGGAGDRPEVRVGDVWEDMDPRTTSPAGRRRVRIIGLIRGEDGAANRAMTQTIGGAQRIHTARLDAFALPPDGRTGYRLIARKGDVVPRPEERSDVGDQFSVRLTGSQAEALDRLGWGGSVSERVRSLVFLCLASACWPDFVDVSVDEDCSEWRQIRLGADLRVALYEYQQAVGCRDLSAAIRSLITSGLAMEKTAWIGK